MPEFVWQARTQQGQIVRGRLEAATLEAIQTMLVARGLILTRVREAKQSGGALGRIKISRKERILLTQQFADALGAGISLVDILQEFSQTYPSQKGRRVLDAVYRHVEGGGTLNDAMSLFPRIFPPMYVAAIESAETTGRLDRVFADLLEHLEREDEMISKVTSSMIYPAVLLCAVSGVATLFVTVLLPKLQPMFSSAGTSLPWFTRILLGLGTLVSDYWMFLLALPPVLVGSLRAVLRTSWGRSLLDTVKIRFPLLKIIVRHLALARFTRAFATLFAAGVPLPQALRVSAAASANLVVQRKLEAARNKVMSGHSLSQALADTGYFGPLDVRMIGVAERTGKFEHALASLSRLHERAARRKIEMAVSFIEPALILCMGALVMGLALSIFLPIYQTLDSAAG